MSSRPMGRSGGRSASRCRRRPSSDCAATSGCRSRDGCRSIAAPCSSGTTSGANTAVARRRTWTMWCRRRRVAGIAGTTSWPVAGAATRGRGGGRHRRPGCGSCASRRLPHATRGWQWRSVPSRTPSGSPFSFLRGSADRQAGVAQAVVPFPALAASRRAARATVQRIAFRVRPDRALSAEPLGDQPPDSSSSTDGRQSSAASNAVVAAKLSVVS